MDCTPIVLAHEDSFTIGAVEVRPATRELRFEGQAAIIEPRVMQVLVALHQAAGGVVSKDDLIQLCWEGRVVGEDAINRVISRLRHEAEHRAGNSFRIETITRVGYRLVSAEGQGPTSSIAAAPDRRRLLIGGASVAVAGGVGAIGWRVLSGSRPNSEARALFEEGRSALMDGTPDSISNAVAKLRSASELAPDNAEILGLLSVAYLWEADDSPGDQRRVSRARGFDAARRALAIDGNNGDALATIVRASFSPRDLWGFETRTRDALKRAPQHPQLIGTLAVFLAEVGRNEDALPYFSRLVQDRPMAVYPTMWRTMVLWSLGRLDEAERSIDNAYRLWPRHFAIWFVRNYFLAYNGHAEQALAMVQDVASRPVGIPDWNFDIVALQARALATRDPAIIDQAMDGWLDAAKRGMGFAQNAIVFAGAMGKLDTAFQVAGAYYFDRGFAMSEQRYSREQGLYSARTDRHTYFLFHRDLRRFRRDPRFGPLAKEIGLADYWAKSGSHPDN